MAKGTSLSYKVVEELAKSSPVMSSLGLGSFEDLQAWYEGLELFEKIDIFTVAVNNLEVLDPLFSPITEEGTDATFEEFYTRTQFRKSNWDVHAKGDKPTVRMFSMGFDDYGVSVELTQKVFLKGQLDLVDRMVASILPAYQRKLRELTLQALLVKPTDENKNIPCFWRDTSGFTSDENKFAPYPYGNAKFGNDESHYLAKASIDKSTIDELTDKVRGKGYGDNGLVVLANEKTWKTYDELYSYDEIRKMERVQLSPNFAHKWDAVNYVSMPNFIFPDNYIICFDPSVQGVYKKIAETQSMQGLVKMFDNMDDVKRTNYTMEFMLFETGVGIREKGFGAVMYLGGATYVNPDIVIY